MQVMRPKQNITLGDALTAEASPFGILKKHNSITKWMIHKRRLVKNMPFGRGRTERISSAIMVAQAKSVEFGQDIIAPFVNDSRTQQLQDITDSDTSSDTSLGIYVQKQSIKNFAISSVGLLLVLGARFYTLLYVPGLLLVASIFSISFKRAYQAIAQKRSFNMDVITVTTATAAFIGGFFVMTAFACWLNQATSWLTAKTEYRSRKGMMNLFGEQPRFVWIVDETLGDLGSTKEVEIPFDQVQIGDQVAVMAGQMIPVDGTISKGIGSIDQHKLTGEGQPTEKTMGDEFFASTVVLSGKIIVQVEKTGEEMVASQIGQTLNNTAHFNLSMKSQAEAFTEKVMPGIFALSGATLLFSGLRYVSHFY